LDSNATQILEFKPASNETSVVLNEVGKIRDYQWAPDGVRLAILRFDRDTRAPDDAIVVGRHTQFLGLWVVDVQSGEERRLSPENQSYWTCRWSPDGRSIATLASESPIAEGLEYQSRLTIVDVESSKQRVLAQRTNPQAAPSFSPDGSTIAFMAPLGDFKERGVPHLVSVKDGLVTPLLESYRGHAWDLLWHPVSGKLLAGLTEGTVSYLSTVSAESEVNHLVSVHYSLIPYWNPVWSVNAAGTQVAFLSEERSAALEVWIAASDGSIKKRLTHLNPRLDDTRLGVAEAIQWFNSEDEKPVEGILVKPADLDTSAPAPLVVWLHGGPAYNWGLGGHATGWTQLLASRGYLVLLPNFRGSSGYGMDWMTANVRNWGEGPLSDVLGGVDSLVKSGLVDDKRVFLGGGSYGGYLSFWAITQTHRFKAAFVRAGIADVASEYALTDEPTFLIGYFGATPYQEPDLYRNASALTFADQVKTPLLIIHGKDDARVPLDQGLRFHDALKHHGVPVKMVIYPGEGHSVRGYDHRLDAMKRLLDWYERWDPGSQAQPEQKVNER
jgi:dipeptidyl aminopeptidase/acylaminoacyl peptidase